MNIEKSAISIVKTLQKAGHQAVFAGGAVRDMLLGKTPHDYDIATSATPDEVEALFNNTKSVGKAFGVILVRIGKIDFEVATFRSDGDYSDGRRPDSVIFSSMEEDAKRRDFTCNALFYDPINDRLHDFVGGVEDIKNKILRFVGDPEERIREDKLRLLRFVRFLVKLEFNMDTMSYIAVRRNAMNVCTISPERIREELIKMLGTKHPNKAISLLFNTHLIYFMLQCVAALENEEQDPIWHPEGATVRKIILEKGDKMYKEKRLIQTITTKDKNGKIYLIEELREFQIIEEISGIKEEIPLLFEYHYEDTFVNKKSENTFEYFHPLHGSIILTKV